MYFITIIKNNTGNILLNLSFEIILILKGNMVHSGKSAAAVTVLHKNNDFQ